jgi:hypothetical protein
VNNESNASGSTAVYRGGSSSGDASTAVATDSTTAVLVATCGAAEHHCPDESLFIETIYVDTGM